MDDKEKIDFVISWVDGSDERWIKEKQKYSSNEYEDSAKYRYRDWDILKYWFRSVEKYATWVNKIYFITWGHIPRWLNTENPKLVIVNHKDYIPEEYLPTFNSHTIELNLHRINGLSERFVYFNDDMFITDKVNKEYFFKKGLPCDNAIMSPYIPKSYDDISAICWNMIGIINTHFSKCQSIKRNFFKWFNIKNGKKNIRTLLMMPWPRFSGIYETHMPNSYLKSTLKEVWKKEYKILNLSSKDKFRNIKTNVNQWIFRYWQIASGKFQVRKFSQNHYFDLSNDDISNICNAIKKRKYKTICLNDTSDVNDFEERKNMIEETFEKVLPNKSQYEK